jgi:hypothetical protein
VKIAVGLEAVEKRIFTLICSESYLDARFAAVSVRFPSCGYRYRALGSVFPGKKPG